MRHTLLDLWADDTATASVEYALLVAVVVVGCIGAWRGLQQAVEDSLVQVQNSVGQAQG